MHLIIYSILTQITDKNHIILFGDPKIRRSIYSRDLIINSEDHFCSFDKSLFSLENYCKHIFFGDRTISFSVFLCISQNCIILCILIQFQKLL